PSARDLAGAARGTPREMLFETFAELAQMRTPQLEDRWVELCRLDPVLPGDGRPPMARTVIASIAEALQNIDLSDVALDPGVEEAIHLFAHESGSAETASAQLGWLRDAFDQVVISTLPELERVEALRKLNSITQRAIIDVCR